MAYNNVRCLHMQIGINKMSNTAQTTTIAIKNSRIVVSIFVLYFDEQFITVDEFRKSKFYCSIQDLC